MYLNEKQIGEYYLQDNNILDKDNDGLIDEEHFLEIFISYNYKFEILSEEDEEIDIDSMTEMDLSEPNIWKKIEIIKQSIDELIKAVKQLNKKLEEK